MHLLFPGRHHLLTNFQADYLKRCCSKTNNWIDASGDSFQLESPIESIIWAVTSANHANTRRNPVSAHLRVAAIECFARNIPVDSFAYLIDDIGVSSQFADYVIKTIEVASNGKHRLSPMNTVVGCSTPEVIELYESLGFRVIPVELEDRNTHSYREETPWHLFNRIVESCLDGRRWQEDQSLVSKIAAETVDLYRRYDVGERITSLFESDLLTDDGDLTDTRDYNTYVRSFDSGAERKYELVKDFVRPGRIVDVGCCTGSLIGALTRDDRLHESDFYGIEIARQLYVECIHRKQQGAFNNDNVFFYQKDFAAGPMFDHGSVDTFTTFALTHEIESYNGRASLERFLELMRDQLSSHGRWINVDVVGPNHDDMVWMWLNKSDGRNDDFEREFEPGQRSELKAYLDGMSSFTRFLRFARDYRKSYGEQVEFEVQSIDQESYVVLSLRDGCEYISKKDYLDNWESEMHERFCFWSYQDWVNAVENVGLKVLPGSKAFTNPWLVENRYRGKVKFFRPTNNGPEELPYPVTNMLLVAEKL